jgi:hypothetical protein
LAIMKHRLLVISPLFFLLLLALGACSGTSSAFNQYYRGRILDVAIVTMERMPELRYRTIDSQQKVHHYLVTPSEEGMELVLMRLKVENHTATSAIVDINEQAAELRDFLGGKYFPININERVKEVEAPENPAQERSIVFLWNRTFEDGTTKAFELQRDYGIDGWMVFEAPKDTKFRELRWRGGDSLSIEF